MKKVFLLLTLIAATFSAWGAISVDSLFLAGACTLNSNWDSGRLNLVKNGSVYTYIGYFYGSTQGFKMPTSHCNNNTCVRPKSNSSSAVTIEAKRDNSYDIMKSNSPDHKFRVSTDGWYSFTIDLANEKFSVASSTYPSVIYPLGGGTAYGWNFTKPMNETSTGSGKYEGYVDFKASTNQEMKFACMYGNDKTMIGAKTSGTSINGPGSYAAKHYNVYAKMGDYNSKKQVNFSQQDTKFKVNLSSDVTYFVRVDLTNTSNDYTVTIKQKPTFSITTTAVTAKVGTTITRAITTNSDGTKSYSSSDTKIATVDANGVVTMKAAGTATITAKVAESNTYGPMSASYTVTVERYLPELAFAEASKTVCKNAAPFIIPLQNKGNGKVKYTSTGVADVDENTGLITIKGVGPATITATSAETALYSAGNATFNLTVTSNLSPATLAPVDITVTKVVNDFKTQDGSVGWDNSSMHPSVNLNNDITITGSDGNHRYVTSKALRLYQWSNKGQFTLQGKTGVTIKSVAFKYTADGTSILCKRYYDPEGKNVPESDRVVSETTYDVNANSVAYYTGSPDANKNYVDIEKYTAVYTDPSIVFEQFSAYTGGQSTQAILGDSGIYKWKVTAQNRSYTIEGYTGIKLEYQDTIASNGDLEGGVKSVSFDWCTAGKDFPNHFIVKAGTAADDVSMAMFSNTERVLTYSHDFNNTNNTTLSIYNPAEESPQRQNHIVLGPVRITPYLLFNVANHAASFDIEQGTTCDLNSALINNTGENKHTFSILENKAGGNPIITDGILDFSSVTKKNGTIKVQAAWEGVTTTLTLTINMKSPNISFTEIKDTVSISEGKYKQEMNKGLSSGAVTYSLVSSPAGASINSSTGEVTFSTAGNYVVKGKIASVSPYAEDSTTYTLTVTRIDPVISFADTSVTKDVLADPFINPLTTPDGAGAISYSSNNATIASVDQKGYVTVHATGDATITANVAQSGIYNAASKSFTVSVTGTVPQPYVAASTSVTKIVEAHGLSENIDYNNVALDDALTLNYCKYYKDGGKDIFRYYQKYTDHLTIQAKPGVIIQTVKFTYNSQYNTGKAVLTKVKKGQSLSGSDVYNSGQTYAVDANSFTCYFGSNAATSDERVQIIDFEIKYFDPQVGVAVTKKIEDLAHQNNYTDQKQVNVAALNNAISLKSTGAGSSSSNLKYYTNTKCFHAYGRSGAIDLVARPGAKILYAKFTFTTANSGALTRKWSGTDNNYITSADVIASDSILFVNSDSVRFYVGTTDNSKYQGTLYISKVYVVYSDATSQIETFESAPANWTLTNCTTGNERIYYDQAVLLNTTNGKVAATVPEGGIKEVSFDWVPSDTSKAVSFNVKAGGTTTPVSTAKYVMTYTGSGVKANNAAFSVEMASGSTTSLKIGHVSLMPYLLYTTKTVDLNLSSTYKMVPQIDNRDDATAITYSFVEDNITFATIDSKTGMVTATDSGHVTVKAAWGDVSTTYSLKIGPQVIVTPKEVTTIPTGKDVEIRQNGIIQMNEAKTLGDVVVKDGGAIELSTAAALTAKNLVISATMGETGTSSQLTGATNSNLTVTGDVFFDLTINKSAPGNQPKDQWHAFTVPFQVSATDGVFKASNGAKLTLGKDYAFRVYNGAKRASGKNGWEAFDGTLQPGVFYVITINGDIATFRFKKDANAPIVTESKSMPVYNYGGTGGNYGWNGIGNSQLDGRYVNAAVQVLDPATYEYKAYVGSDAAQFSVGTPFFYQASEDGSIDLATEVPASVAARAMSAEPKEIAIKFIGVKYSDRLFISSTQEATNEYQIGHDLTKMSMTSTPAVPQIYAKAYNAKLCMVDAPMVNNEAIYALSLYAPQTGDYTLQAAPVQGYEVLLTLNGQVIWNLSQNDCLVSLDKGSADTYGLVLKKMPNTPTGMHNAECTMQGVQKFIYNDQLIIIRDGLRYNGNGQMMQVVK